jgi:hypothetical protein
MEEIRGEMSSEEFDIMRLEKCCEVVGEISSKLGRWQPRANEEELAKLMGGAEASLVAAGRLLIDAARRLQEAWELVRPQSEMGNRQEAEGPNDS